MANQNDLADSISTNISDDDLNALTIDKLIEMGVEVRDELKAESRRFKKFEANAKGIIVRIQHALKLKGDEMKVNSFATNEGTAYRNLKESYRVGDWQKALPWMIETGNLQMLEKRVAKLATREIHKATGAVPPGVEYFAEETFLIRRPNEKGSDDE